MAVTATQVSCASQAWTKVAEGAASAVLLRSEAPGRLLVLPTATDSAPANPNDDTPALPLDTFVESNLVSDAGTYWWVWNPGAVAVNVVVWKL